MISDKTARRIAASWAMGGAPLQCLATSGAIVEGVEAEIEGNIRWTRNYREFLTPPNNYTRDLRELGQLLVYVRHHGRSGPVDGWASIRF